MEPTAKLPERLTETVKARIEPTLAEWLAAHAKRTERSEGAVLRLALREYRTRYYAQKGKGKA